MNPGFVVFGAELPWIFPLAVELGRHGPALGINLGASRRLFRRGTTWPFDDPQGRLTKETWSYPPGFNGTFARLFDRTIRARLMKKMRRLRRQTGEWPYIVTPYPHFLRYLLELDPSRLIYVNYDDNSPSPDAAGRSKLPEEDAIVARAGTVLCNSQYQTAAFKQRFAQKAHAIFHLPHGVHERFLNPAPLGRPEPNTVCVVGVLSSRYDWRLIHEVAERLPAVTFCFAGEIAAEGNPGQEPDWRQRRDAVLGLPNIVHVPGLRHRDTAEYYWKSAANWMPYKPDLAFVRACCPLKLTDGLASGRPVISSEVPECRLYPEWISVHKDAAEAVSLIREALGRTGSAQAIEHTRLQIEFARRNMWASRADRLLAILGEASRRATSAARSA